MDNDSASIVSASIVSASKPATLGDRLRDIAEELRQETDTQIKATSRILGAAAQMAQNHDHLIDEVVEMVEEDLSQEPEQRKALATYNVPALKQDFKTLKAAKAHFGLKANSWDALAAKLNEANESSASNGTGTPSTTRGEVLERLDAIEREMVSLRGDMEQVLGLLQKIVNREAG